MGRSAKAAPTTPTLPASAEQSLAADATKHGELLANRERILNEIDARFGLDQPYDLNTYIGIARDSVAVVSERLLLIGRICVAIKEHEPRGSFGLALEQIGIADRFARKCMAAVVKFEGSDSRKLLASRLASTKLLDLLVEDDDDLDALGDGGTLHGYTVDEFDKMSSRELRAALRAARKERDDEIAARDEIIERKDKKINTLETRARRFAKEPFRVQLDQALIEVGALVVEYESAGAAVREALVGLDAMHDKAGESYSSEVLELIDGWAKGAMALAKEIADLAKA